MRRRVVAGCLLGLAVALTAPSAPVVEAQDEEQRLEEVERKLQDFRNRLVTARSERTEFLEAIEATQIRMTEVKATLSDAEVALVEAEGAVLVVEDAVAGLGRRIRLLDAELASTRLDQRITREMIRGQAVELYMSASPGIETVLFGSEDLKTGVIRLEYTRDILQDTEGLLSSLEIMERQEVNRQDRLREDLQRQEQLLAELEEEAARAARHRAEVEAAREDLRRELATQEALLAEVTADIASHEDHVAALEAESKRIELEILRRQVREGRRPGKLAWPVGGPVTSPFGVRVHPIFGDRRMHTGIDMGSARGAPIHAAGNGVVILAESWGGYGRTVVVDHGGGLATLYAHQSSFAVSVGERVQAGTVIGYIGCSGYCTGPHLHFEVREAGAPVDPMHYLTR